MLHLALADDGDGAVVADRVADLLRSGFGIGVDTGRARLVEDPPARRRPPAAGRTVRGPAAAPAPAVRPAGPASAAGAPERSRLVIERLKFRAAGLEVHCAVTLRHGAGEATGEAVGSATSNGTVRALAGATLRAVEALCAVPVRLEIEYVDLASTGLDSTVLVAVSMLSSSGSTRLTGAAAVRQDVRQAAVRATLDAVNRRLGPLLRPEGGRAG